MPAPRGRRAWRPRCRAQNAVPNRPHDHDFRDDRGPPTSTNETTPNQCIQINARWFGWPWDIGIGYSWYKC